MTDTRPIAHGDPLQAHRSFWLRQAIGEGTYQPCPELRGQQSADVVVVGGGFCGMWAAYELLQREPTMRVAILERDICGGGASGRNAGYVLNLWSKFLTLQTQFSEDGAIAVGRASQQAVEEIERFAATHAPEAMFRRNGWLWGASCEAQNNGWRPTSEALARLNLSPFREVERSDLASRYGLDGLVGAVIDASCGSVQPAKLAFALKRRLLDRGVRIFERSPMTEIVRGPQIEVRTAAGSLRAGKVCIAMNAWAARFGEVRRRIAVVAAEGMITKANPQWVKDRGWTDGPGVTDSRAMIVNYRATTDGRVEIGKGGGAIAFGARVPELFHGNAIRTAQIFREFTAEVSAGSALEVDQTWMGPIDRSYDGLPFVDFLGGDRRIAYAAGFSGNGVAPTKLISKSLAALLTDTADDWAASPLVARRPRVYPPEPIKKLAAHAVRAAVQRKDTLDHRGQRASWPVRWLAGKLPSSLVPSGNRPAARQG